MAKFTFFHEFGKKLGEKQIDLANDEFGWILTNNAPNAATDEDAGDITEISAGNGYSSGGETLANSSWAESSAGSGEWVFSGDSTVFEASGGSIGPFRYAVLVDRTATGDPVVGFIDYGSSITITSGNTFSINVTGGGIFKMPTVEA